MIQSHPHSQLGAARFCNHVAKLLSLRHRRPELIQSGQQQDDTKVSTSLHRRPGNTSTTTYNLLRPDVRLSLVLLFCESPTNKPYTKKLGYQCMLYQKYSAYKPKYFFELFSTHPEEDNCHFIILRDG